MLHQIGLYFHMLAILFVGAGGIGGAIVEFQLWKKLKMESYDSRAILPILQVTGKFIMFGIILFLVSGLIMLYSVHWAYLSQPWFIAKFALFLCLPVRAAMIARPSMMQVGMEIKKDKMDTARLMKIKSRMDRFHVIQYGIVLVIIFLVIFKL